MLSVSFRILYLGILLALAVGGCSSESDETGDDGGAADVCTGRGCADDTGGSPDGTGEACASTADCSDGLVCSDGRCVPACDDDSECGATERCETASGECVEAVPCEDSSTCSTGETCDTCAGVCRPSTGGAVCQRDENCPGFDDYCDTCLGECQPKRELCAPCTADIQCGEDRDLCLNYASGSRACGVACGGDLPSCPAGYACDTEAGQCTPLTGDCGAVRQCEDDAECPGVQICSATGLCVPGCIADEACTAGNVCVGARCVPPCTSDSDCADGQTCEDGRCKVPGGCTTSRECLEPETYCDRALGMCVDGCQIDDDCLDAAKECAAGSCVPRGCRGNYSCAFEQICELGTGLCEAAVGPYCDECNGDDVDSCGATNACLNLQDADGNDLGAFCMVGCAADPDNACPQGYACEEIDLDGDIRRVCVRPCNIDPIE